MSLTQDISREPLTGVFASIKDVGMLMKFKLSLMVVFSAVIGFAIASSGNGIVWLNLVWLVLGGFLITGSANAINQIIERDLDKLMPRTANRPLPTGRMRVSTATIIAGISGLIGISLLAIQFNLLSGLLGALALISYAFVYTPMKRVSPFAVFAGAFPGAISPLIGWVAFSGEIGLVGMILFGIQFLWQFPHFWAIAWVSDEDYKKAGFHLLPTPEGKNKITAIYCLIYSFTLLIISIIPLVLHLVDIVPGVLIAIIGAWFLYKSFQLYIHTSDQHAKKLMIASFFYLPLVFILLLIG